MLAASDLLVISGSMPPRHRLGRVIQPIKFRSGHDESAPHECADMRHLHQRCGSEREFCANGLSPNTPTLAQTNAAWEKDVTALVIAPDGTWGTATEPFSGKALGKAIADCKSKYSGKIGCGYRSTFVREGWSLSIRCGQVNIIVAEKSLRVAGQTAIQSEFIQRRDYHPNMPPCVRVVTVDANGKVIAPHHSHVIQLLTKQVND